MEEIVDLGTFVLGSYDFIVTTHRPGLGERDQ